MRSNGANGTGQSKRSRGDRPRAPGEVVDLIDLFSLLCGLAPTCPPDRATTLATGSELGVEPPRAAKRAGPRREGKRA